MAKVYFKLSNKVQDNGKCNVIVWCRFSRTLQIQVQTTIQVLPKHFEVIGSTGGANYGVVKVPNKSKLNFVEVKEANEAKTRLQDFTNKLLRLQEVTPSEELTKDYIKKAVGYFDRLSVQELTEGAIQKCIEDDERVREEAEAQKQRITFFNCAETYLKEKNFAYSQVRNFKAMLRCLHRWQEYRKSINPKEHFTIDFDTLIADDVQDFKDYLRNEYTLQDECTELFQRLLTDYPAEYTPKHKGRIEPRGENTIIKMLKRLKAFWRWAMFKGYTSNNAFEGVEMGEAIYGVPFYLTIEERNTLADYDLTDRPQLAIQRDVFVFQCLIGCRVSDLYKLTDANITNGILEYVPIKTKDNKEQVKPRIPLNERAKSLIKQYKGVDKKGRLFPFISSQKYNDAIKEALKVCGIDRGVQVRNSLTGDTEVRPIYEVASSHMARRTFIGAAYSKVQDPNLIGRMSGHVEGSRAFARYRAIDDDLLKNVINMID